MRVKVHSVNLVNWMNQWSAEVVIENLDDEGAMAIYDMEGEYIDIGLSVETANSEDA